MSSQRDNTARLNVKPLDADAFAPTLLHPVRRKSREHVAKTEVQSHCHSWAQMVFASRGVARVLTDSAAYVVPPWRAVWIPPSLPHAATVLEHADLHAVFLLPSEFWGAETLIPVPQRFEWHRARVIEVGPLLREVVLALAERTEDIRDVEHYKSLCVLIFKEVHTAPAVPLGVCLPKDRRLRALCDAFLKEPTLNRSLETLASDAGASVSTIHRLFRCEIGSSFTDWREHALVAHAIALAAKGCPIGQIAFDLGYSSNSAFSAMVTRVTGVPPSKLFLLGGQTAIADPPG
jgi:AraC-like DNA-binding protein